MSTNNAYAIVFNGTKKQGSGDEDGHGPAHPRETANWLITHGRSAQNALKTS